MKKVGVLGTGKTGSEVTKALKAKGYEVAEFNRSNVLSLDKAKELDGIITFLPGGPFLEYVDILLDSKLPVVSGATGFEFTEDQLKRISTHSSPWVVSSNFSISMAVAKFCIEQIASWAKRNNANEKIHEVHHTAKVDAPSGTALFWEKWIKSVNPKSETKITYDRLEDVPGTHSYIASGPKEELEITHTAKDRSIFAEGAVWALEQITTYKETGSVDFFELVKKQYMKT